MQLPPLIRGCAAAGAAVRLLFAFFCLLAGASAQAGPTEYEAKAAFIYNIAKFVEWPAKPGPDNAPLHLCVLGKDPFGPALEEIKGKLVKERKMEVALLDVTADARECDLLFIAASEERHLDRVVAILRGAGTLTVGDTEGYAQRGVMINFFHENGKIRFEINLDAVRRAGLKVSSKLLFLARIVDSQSLR